MKKRLLLLVVLGVGLACWGEVHIQISDISTWSPTELAGYINQTVVFDDPLVVCSNGNSSLTVAPKRSYEPLSQGVAGSREYKSTVHINGCTMSLSGVSGYHRCGEKIYNLRAKVNSTSSLSFISGDWHGNTRADLEASLPDIGDYRLLVCGFNVENYFTSVGCDLCPKSSGEHQKQRAKVSKALAKINADIYGFAELEQGNDAVNEIVSDLNKNLPGRNYKTFSDGTNGSSQKVEFVYDANKVEAIGTPVEITAELRYRKKMICFREKATGEKFIYSINHFKAMNTGDETRRENEARAVYNTYNTYRSNRNVREQDLLVMGDLNSYAYTKPIFVFTDNNMIDLHPVFHADSSYSYMYSGRASYIDHAICSETLYRQITGMAAYHINSDESKSYSYSSSDDNTMFRCSDHDPVLVGLKLDSTLSMALEPYITTQNNTGDSLTVYNIYDRNHPEHKSYFAIYRADGLTICPPTEIVFTDEMIDQKKTEYTISGNSTAVPEALRQFLPLPTGIYIFHLYYKGQVYQRKLIIK